MAKSLKEALLEKFSDLQQLGIAPTTAPVEDDLPAVVVEMGSERYGESGGRRQRSNRGTMYDDDLGRGGDVPIRPRSPRRGRERGERGGGRPPAGGERFRRGERGERPAGIEDLAGGPSALRGGPGAGPRPPFAERPGGPRPPFGERPGGPRPPFGERPGGRPMGGPPRMGEQRGPGGPGMGTTDRLRQRAEQRRRDEGLREQLQGLLASIGGAEATPEVYDKFLADLTIETGALPPLERVVEAVQLANSIEPAKVGNAVRQLFRRPRPRPSAPRPPAPAASQS